jgi:hypothetical protein
VSAGGDVAIEQPRRDVGVGQVDGSEHDPGGVGAAVRLRCLHQRIISAPPGGVHRT